MPLAVQIIGVRKQANLERFKRRIGFIHFEVELVRGDRQSPTHNAHTTNKLTLGRVVNRPG